MVKQSLSYMAPRPDLITIRQLRAIAAVAAGGSVTAAARSLNLTQPAITMQLRNLEELAGLPLIQRTGDGMVPTEAGREVLRLAARVDAAVVDCGRTRDMMSGRPRVDRRRQHGKVLHPLCHRGVLP